MLRVSAKVGVSGRDWLRAASQTRAGARLGPNDQTARRVGLPRLGQNQGRPGHEVRRPGNSPLATIVEADNIRLLTATRLTNELVTTAIAAGADWITIHGRTRHQSSSGHPVNLAAIRTAAEFAQGKIPVVANGDVFSWEDAQRTRAETGVGAVMSARGLLANPCLYAGYAQTPRKAVEEFLDLSTGTGLIFPLFHKHTSYMLEGRLARRRRDRVFFNSLDSHAGVIDWLDDEFAGWTE